MAAGPDQSEESTIPVPPSPGRPLNRKYLRAVHDYVPALKRFEGTAGETSRTVPLRPGDLILVHLTHANGWADGTVLNSGIRGWLPTNYCDTFDHEHIRNLFHALTKFWGACISHEGTSPQDGPGEEMINPMIAGVRHLLEQAQCLHRQDAIVRNNIAIYRSRKVLLSELATLVKQFELVSSTGTDDDPDLIPNNYLEQYIHKAFQVAIRAARFLDVWLGNEVEEEAQEAQEAQEVVPVAPRSASAASERITYHVARSPSPTRKPHIFLQHRKPVRTAIPLPIPTKRTDIGLGINTAGENASDSEAPERRDSSVQMSTSASSDGIVPEVIVDNGRLASERLTAAHDTFLDHIGSFIGLHMQSRPGEDVARKTSRSLQTCARLLATINAIRSQSSQPSLPFNQTIDFLEQSSSKLAEAASILPSSQTDTEHFTILSPAQGRALIMAATACIRCAGECVMHAREVIDRDGDFELPDAAIHTRSLTPQLEEQGPVKELRSRPSQVRILSGDVIHRPDSPLSRLSEKPEPDNGSQAMDQPSDPPHHASFLWTSPARQETTSTTKSGSTERSRLSGRDSSTSLGSQASTRATTPDNDEGHIDHSPRLQARDTSGDYDRNDMAVARYQADQQHLTYAAELLYGRQGQILGGTLRALIECMTSQSVVPDPKTVRTFFLTFRSFTSAVELADALIERYLTAEVDALANSPARLRVFNMFKQWLENHWDSQSDQPALDKIRRFVLDGHIQQLPSARQRLLDLVDKAYCRSSNESLQPLLTLEYDNIRPGSPMKSSFHEPPAPLITKAQLVLLTKIWQDKCSVVDFEAIELARQLTLINCRLYCAVPAHELLAKTMPKKEGRSPNLLALSRMSTNLANLVQDSILFVRDVKKRANVLKQWIKIASSCYDLRNYDSLMAIMCALSSSTVSRLKRTLALVPAKHNHTFDKLMSVVDTSKNYASMRQRLQHAQLPCLPFVGIFLTDLTFVDAGNPNTRSLWTDQTRRGDLTVINFDKHNRTAKIIQQFQSFQMPYDVQDVPDLQGWLHTEFDRIHDSKEENNQRLYQQSLEIEPREDGARPAGQVKSGPPASAPFWNKKSPQVDGFKPKWGFAIQRSYVELRSRSFSS